MMWCEICGRRKRERGEREREEGREEGRERGWGEREGGRGSYHNSLLVRLAAESATCCIETTQWKVWSTTKADSSLRSLIADYTAH